MKWKAIWLPVDKPLEDGCMVITSGGEVFEYDINVHDRMAGHLKPCELFIVSFEYNVMVVIGKPSKRAAKWLTAGMEVKSVDCEQALYNDTNNEYCKVLNLPAGERPENYLVIRIKCPFCQELH